MFGTEITMQVFRYYMIQECDELVYSVKLTGFVYCPDSKLK